MIYFIQVDVTPPILIFKRKPNRSQSKVNITWDTNEETNGLCQVEGSSSFYRSVVCNKAWSDDYLPEGEFILKVTVYDLSLNMAGPFQHKWYNSKYIVLTLSSFVYCYCLLCCSFFVCLICLFVVFFFLLGVLPFLAGFDFLSFGLLFP